MARKTRGQFSISQTLLDEMKSYVEAESVQPGRTKALTATAVVEAGLVAFFEADAKKRVDLLLAAVGLRPMTKWGEGLTRDLGVDSSPTAGRHVAKRSGGGKHG